MRVSYLAGNGIAVAQCGGRVVIFLLVDIILTAPYVDRPGFKVLILDNDGLSLVGQLIALPSQVRVSHVKRKVSVVQREVVAAALARTGQHLHAVVRHEVVALIGIVKGCAVRQVLVIHLNKGRGCLIALSRLSDCGDTNTEKCGRTPDQLVAASLGLPLLRTGREGSFDRVIHRLLKIGARYFLSLIRQDLLLLVLFR